jgi:tetratricopeptide (TPR) repeat protein
VSRPRLTALLLALATLVIFLPAGRFDFLNFDDPEYVTENPMVREGLTGDGVAWAFDGFHASNWHPLTWLSHMADCTLFGLNPGAQHFVNVLFHAANAALLFALLWRLTQRFWPSALTAALFAWHPLRVESVAWISERKDVLSTFFALLTLLAYARHAKEKEKQKEKESGKPNGKDGRGGQARLYYAICLGLFALGLMAKPMLVTLPFVMLLLDYWPLARISKSAGFRRSVPALIVEKIPFLVLCAISCVITYLAQKNGEAVVPLTTIPLALRLENAPVAMAGYLRDTFWPAGLCVIYPMPRELSAVSVVLCAAVLAGITVAVWRWRWSRPYAITGWLWFLGTLVPVIGLVQVGGQSMADRYTYIPSIGLLTALVFLAAELAERMKAPVAIRTGGAAAALIACVAVTEHQLPYWRNSETLFRRAIAVTHDNSVAMINLGVALEAEGRLQEAVDAYRDALATGNQRREIFNNLGHALSRLGRHAEALAVYQQALALEPGDPALHTDAGSELSDLGRFSEAQREFSLAESLAPNQAAPHLDSAMAWLKTGNEAKGLEELQTAVRLEPDNFKTLAAAARVLAANDDAAARDGKKALQLALKADELSGHAQPVVLDVLGMAYAESGDFTNAVAAEQSALDAAEAAHFENTNGMNERITRYQQNRPWRESFRAPAH